MEEALAITAVTVVLWFFAGLFAFIAYILLLVGIAHWAKRWGYKPARWVWTGLFFSPVIASVLLLMEGPDEKTNRSVHVIEKLRATTKQGFTEIQSLLRDRLPLDVTESGREPVVTDVKLAPDTEDSPITLGGTTPPGSLTIETGDEEAGSVDD